MKTGRVTLFLISSILAAQQQLPPTDSSLKTFTHGVYYQAGQEWKKLETVGSAGFSTKHGAGALVGVAPSGVRTYDGAEAANQYENRRPVFGIRVDASRPDIPGLNARDLIMVRMTKKKDHRELQVLKGGFASVRSGLNAKDEPELALTMIADLTYTLTPKSDLEPGEYILIFRRTHGTSGYDFGIK